MTVGPSTADVTVTKQRFANNGVVNDGSRDVATIAFAGVAWRRGAFASFIGLALFEPHRHQPADAAVDFTALLADRPNNKKTERLFTSPLLYVLSF